MSVKNYRRYLQPLATRKPGSWDEAPMVTGKLSETDKAILRSLPLIETSASLPYENFLGDEPPVECVVKVGDRVFYVVPEGYPYARYAFEFSPSALDENSNINHYKT